MNVGQTDPLAGFVSAAMLASLEGTLTADPLYVMTFVMILGCRQIK